MPPPVHYCMKGLLHSDCGVMLPLRFVREWDRRVTCRRCLQSKDSPFRRR